MKNIGKYNGIPCYTCTNVEWKSYYDKGKDNGSQIFIIDGIMVRNNKIVGHYDGQHVKDRYDGVPYYKNEMKNRNEKSNEEPKTAENSKWDEEFKATETETTVVVSSYEELVKQDIDFGRYSTVVDEFFALLEV